MHLLKCRDKHTGYVYHSKGWLTFFIVVGHVFIDDITEVEEKIPSIARNTSIVVFL